MDNAILDHIENCAERFALTVNDRIVVKGIEYRQVYSDDGGHVLSRVSQPDIVERISHDVLAKYRGEGKFTYVSDYHKQTRASVFDTERRDNIRDLSEKNRARVFWCKDFCDAFLEMERAGEATRSEPSMKAAIRKINAKVAEIETKKQVGDGRCGNVVEVKIPPSASILRDWLRKYQAADGDPIVLKYDYAKSGNRTPRLEPEVVELLDAYAAEHPTRTKSEQKLIYGELTAALETINNEREARGEQKLRVPSVTALRNAIKKLDPYLDYVGRNGEAAAKKKFYPVQGGVRARRPYERLEMDEWLVSLQTLLVDAKIWRKLSKEEKRKAKRVRVWISAAIDVATRCIVALRVLKKAPDHESALATLRMAISNKRAIAEAAGCKSTWDMEGTPYLVCVDTGAAWYSDEFRMACADLGIEVMYPPAGMPQFRAHIERVFGTIHSQFVARFDGRTFANILIKGDYDAAAHAMMDVAELERLMIRYVVDVYHNTKHSGLGDEMPAAAWKRLRADWGVRPPPDADELRHIFGTPKERWIHNEGIHVLGSYYRSPATHAYRRSMGNKPKRVMTRVDQTDLGQITFRMGRKWVSVPCVREGLDGVSAHEWFEMNRVLRRKRRDEADAVLPIVHEAIRVFRTFRKSAEEDAGLGSPVYTYQQLEKLDRWFKAAGEQTRAADSDPVDFLGDADVPEGFVENSDRPNVGTSGGLTSAIQHAPEDDGFMDEAN